MLNKVYNTARLKITQFEQAQPFGISIDKGKEGNVLFNDTLNTFYLQLYDIRHMVKDHSDSERGNPLPPHGLLFSISSKGIVCNLNIVCIYIDNPADRITHTMAFVTPVVEH